MLCMVSVDSTLRGMIFPVKVLIVISIYEVDIEIITNIVQSNKIEIKTIMIQIIRSQNKNSVIKI